MNKSGLCGNENTFLYLFRFGVQIYPVLPLPSADCNFVPIIEALSEEVYFSLKNICQFFCFHKQLIK